MEAIITESNQSDTGSTADIIFYGGKTLHEEISSRVQDPSLIERYGTSMEFGTQYEYSLYLMKKYYRLKKELLKVFRDIKQEISCKDLQDFFALYENKTKIHLGSDYIERFWDDLFADVNIKKTM